jgi:hypothetical protein
MNESDLTTFYYAFGGSTQPDLNSSLWVNHPRKNQGIDTDYEFHFDYSIYDSSSAPALQYYTHTPMGATLITDESWLWIKFTRGSNTFISGTLIGDRELFIQNPEENTQYIGTIMYISEPDPPTPPDPPITTTKYRIYVNRYDNHQRVTNENIWAGNVHVPADAPYCKKTSGTTGADYAYVEFSSWDDLVRAVGGSGPADFLTATISVDDFEAQGGQAILSIDSNTSWTIITNTWISVERTSGSGSIDLRVEVEENDGDYVRSGTITVRTTGGTVVSIPIQQRKNSDTWHKITLGYDEMSVAVNDTQRNTAWYHTYEGQTEIDIEDVTEYADWRTSDENIAVAGRGGDITGVSPGETYMWAIYMGETSNDTRIIVY